MEMIFRKLDKQPYGRLIETYRLDYYTERGYNWNDIAKLIESLDSVVRVSTQVCTSEILHIQFCIYCNILVLNSRA